MNKEFHREQKQVAGVIFQQFFGWLLKPEHRITQSARIAEEILQDHNRRKKDV